METLNAHLNLYYSALRTSFRLEGSLLGKPAKPQGFSMELDDMSLQKMQEGRFNFFTTRYLFLEQNKQNKLDYVCDEERIDEFTESMRKFYRESNLLEKARFVMPLDTILLLQ